MWNEGRKIATGDGDGRGNGEMEKAGKVLSIRGDRIVRLDKEE